MSRNSRELNAELIIRSVAMVKEWGIADVTVETDISVFSVVEFHQLNMVLFELGVLRPGVEFTVTEGFTINSYLDVIDEHAGRIADGN